MRSWSSFPAAGTCPCSSVATSSPASSTSSPPRSLAPEPRRYHRRSCRTLSEVAAEAATCTRCRLAEGRTNVVFGMGDPHADLMFVGEGPGAEEDRQGLPFVGRSGQLLDKLMRQELGFSRESCFIANVVKCRPPGNRDPRPDEIEACQPYLDLRSSSSLPAWSSPWATSPPSCCSTPPKASGASGAGPIRFGGDSSSPPITRRPPCEVGPRWWPRCGPTWCGRNDLAGQPR